MEEKQKVLLCGDVEGKFNALFKRVNTIIKKSGHFDMLLCVGNFFGDNNDEFEEYKTGVKKVPLPTYVLGPNNSIHEGFYPKKDEKLCSNIIYLGKRGLFLNNKGLRIAYLSGVNESNSDEVYHYNKNDINELFNACVGGTQVFRGVDILLTSQWPKGIVVNPEQSAITTKFSSELPNWLIMKLKPRYVVSGLEDIFYERPPFRIPCLGEHDSTMEISSRFIALAKVNNSKNAKWIYALSLTPLCNMKISDLIQKSIDETNCPFNFTQLQRNIFNINSEDGGKKQYFYDTTSSFDEPKKKRQKKEKIVFDQEKCWFCLASPSVEKHLLITIGDHCYLSLAKGGVVEEHFLICPIQHFQSSLNLPELVKLELDQFKETIKKFFKRNDKVPVFFERNYKTSHMQLQCIPIPKSAAKKLQEAYMEEADGNHFCLNILDTNSSLNDVLRPNIPFFVVELPDGCILYNQIKGNFPIDFGREVVCTKHILNMPHRIEWKKCVPEVDIEMKLVQRIKTDFEPFDFTL